ncbi:MAG: YrdB family protein [Corynebacteriales bacterium]|nr:YrdB family protein [Mycobacteriales bacterium]
MNDTTPVKPGWNDLLRFFLELVMFASYAWLGAEVASWLGGFILPIAAAFAWALFSTPGDPGRNPKSVIPTPGPVRFVLELALLGGGCVALWILGQPILFAICVALNVLHLWFAQTRTRWLLSH